MTTRAKIPTSLGADAPVARPSGTGPISGEPATVRLSRLLTMVPWLMNRQGIDIEDAARTLGVSASQIEADLRLLFVCGTPGHLPDDLIEAEWEHGHVYVRNADEISKPLRLTRDEALALSVGLRALLDVPGLTERDAVDRALAKLVEATGETTPRKDQISVRLESDPQATVSACREAISAKKQLHLRYLVPSRDEVTERNVDPWRLFTSDGHWYLEAWCHEAAEPRTFRLDRVLDLHERDASITHAPAASANADTVPEFFSRVDDTTSTARLRLAPPAAWVCEFYPCHNVVRHEDHVDATFVIGDGRWLTRLLLQLGSHARVLDPATISADVAAQARAALDAYGV